MESKKFQKFYNEKDDNGKTVSNWGVLFGVNSLHLENYMNKHKLYLNISDEVYLKYKDQDVINGVYTVSKGGEIKTREFTLSVYVHEYKAPSSEKNEGNLDFIASSMSTSITIPYKMAIDIMKFMEALPQC